MAADALVTCVTKASATMILTNSNKQVLVFHEEWFKLPTPSPCWEMIEDTNIPLGFGDTNIIQVSANELKFHA